MLNNGGEFVSNFLHEYVFDMVPTDELNDFVDQVLKSLGDSKHVKIIRKIYLDSLKEEIIFRVENNQEERGIKDEHSKS